MLRQHLLLCLGPRNQQWAMVRCFTIFSPRLYAQLTGVICLTRGIFAYLKLTYVNVKHIIMFVWMH